MCIQSILTDRASLPRMYRLWVELEYALTVIDVGQCDICCLKTGSLNLIQRNIDLEWTQKYYGVLINNVISLHGTDGGELWIVVSGDSILRCFIYKEHVLNSLFYLSFQRRIVWFAENRIACKDHFIIVISCAHATLRADIHFAFTSVK